MSIDRSTRTREVPAPTAATLATRVRDFVEAHVLPAETAVLAGGPDASGTLAGLQHSARELGLWGIANPPALGGLGLPLVDYLRIAEQEGRSLIGPACLGSEMVVDAHMLSAHGSPEVRTRFLRPMVEGRAVPSFGMTEPGRASSDSGGLQARASLEDGMWTVRGRKWFISNASRADFMTVVARTAAVGKHPRESFSLIVVPTDAPGFRIVRPLTVLGQTGGQSEVELDGVRVPESHVVGTVHGGMEVVQQRLGLARVLRAMSWLGQAQRGYDLMCGRMRIRKVMGAPLSDKQLMQQMVFQSYLEIHSARALIKRVAAQVETGRVRRADVSIAKVAASRAVCDVLDRAVQAYGAEGLSDDDSPLSRMWRAARTTRILDGPDEVHIATGGYQLLQADNPMGTDFAAFDALEMPTVR